MEIFVWVVYGIKLFVFKNMDINEFLQFTFVLTVQRDTAPPTKYTARSSRMVPHFFVLIWFVANDFRILQGRKTPYHLPVTASRSMYVGS